MISALQSRTARWGVAATCLAALAGVSALGIAWADSPSPSSAPLPQPASTIAPLPAPTGPTATPAGVSAALAPVLADPSLGSPMGLLVADGTTGSTLFDSLSSTPLVPASTQKVLTSAATLRGLGTDTVLTTRVVSNPDGTVVLVGGGDPLLTADPGADGAGTSILGLASSTAAALRDKGITSARVAIDDSAFTGPIAGPAWDDDDLTDCLVRPIQALSLFAPAAENPTDCTAPDPDPALTAGKVFAERLAAFGVTVSGEVTRATAAATANTLATGESRPVAALVEQMLTDSDNTSAEMLAHLLGGKVAGEASFAGGAKAVTSEITRLGVPTAGLLVLDGSGLSTADRVAPATVSAVLHKVVTGADPALWPIASGLPVAGFDGTLADRFAAPDTLAGRGDVRAKTGTLTGVSALSGQVVSADGQLLTFVLISNGAEDILASRAAQDKVAATLATCGCHPGA